MPSESDSKWIYHWPPSTLIAYHNDQVLPCTLGNVRKKKHDNFCLLTADLLPCLNKPHSLKSVNECHQLHRAEDSNTLRDLLMNESGGNKSQVNDLKYRPPVFPDMHWDVVLKSLVFDVLSRFPRQGYFIDITPQKTNSVWVKRPPGKLKERIVWRSELDWCGQTWEKVLSHLGGFITYFLIWLAKWNFILNT